MFILFQKNNKKAEFNNMNVLSISYVQIGNLKIVLLFKKQGDGKYL